MTIDDDATKLDFGVELKTDETIEISQCGLLFATDIDDGHRYGNYTETATWTKQGDRSGVDLPQELPPRGRGSQYLVYAARQYPEFTQSRIDAGTADADETDAPLDILRTGALAELFRMRSGAEDEDTTRYKELAKKYMEAFDSLAADHLGMPEKATLPWKRRGALASVPTR